jgi:2-dehydropantoate 2-reductase
MSKIAAEGLTIRWPEQPPQISTPATATTMAALSPPYDFILITAKAPATLQIITQLREYPALLENATLVSLQNGLGNEEALAEAFGPEKVIAGTVTIPIQVPAPGVIEVSKAKGGLGLAPLTPGQPVARLAEALTQAGLNTPVYDDYRAMKWSKLLLNIVNNAATAILDMPPTELIANPALFNLEIQALREGVQVMQTQGIRGVKLPGYPVDWLVRILGAGWLPLPLKSRPSCETSSSRPKKGDI